MQLLHTPWAWRYIHHIHHQFLTPTPFAQDAVHPVEGIVQGPLGHHLITLFTPIHPAAHAFLGFITSVYAIGAHDGTRPLRSARSQPRWSDPCARELVGPWRLLGTPGRSFDWNDHVKHHSHKHVNYGLYWGFWDYVCGTRYDPKKHKAATTPEY